MHAFPDPASALGPTMRPARLPFVEQKLQRTQAVWQLAGIFVATLVSGGRQRKTRLAAGWRSEQRRPCEVGSGQFSESGIFTRQRLVIADQQHGLGPFVQQAQRFHHARLGCAARRRHANRVGGDAAQYGMLRTDAVVHRQPERRGRQCFARNLCTQQCE
ncbi:hypothetical protein SDC9_137309 [bioreactor metagenome]|uniref:Uncharacterized protein n=1 Tax=bioreactor metagenome TaxID=1076179 RepID=A0A645DNT8_9ZZZZ